MTTQIEAFNWIMDSRDVPELLEAAKKIEASFIDVRFAKYAYAIRYHELLEGLGFK